MPLTTIHAAPSVDSFTTLEEHQTQTPTSFYGAKPVLHYHGPGYRAIALGPQISKLPIFARSTDGQARPGEATESGPDDPKIVEVVDVFISSENLTLFNPATSTGVSIPYPVISLHAIQRLEDPSNSSQQVQGLYMQVEPSDLSVPDDDDEQDVIEMTLVPPPDSTEGPAIQTLFEAVSNCSNLHPDPAFEDEDMEGGEGDSRIVFEGSVGYDGISGLPGVQRGAADGGLPPPFPGSGGWITAENVSEYFDSDGSWIGGGDGSGLGEGAGNVHGRDEVHGGVNGHGEEPDTDENKRARTD